LVWVAIKERLPKVKVEFQRVRQDLA